MSSRTVIEIKTRGWSATFRPFSFSDSVTIGDSAQDVSVPGCPAGISLSLSASDKQLHLRLCGAVLRETDADSLSLNAQEAPHLHIIDRKTAQEYFSIAAHYEADPFIPCFDWQVRIPEGETVTVGADDSAGIQLRHPLQSGQILTLLRSGSTWTVTAASNAPLGVHLNTTRIRGAVQAMPGDFITAPGLHLYLDTDCLLLAANEDIRVRAYPVETGLDQTFHLQYPRVTRTPRLPAQVPSEPIPLQDPPPVPAENRSNLLISLLPAAAMILLTILLRGSYSSNSQMILFSVLSLSVGAVTSVLTYLQTGKERRNAVATRETSYRAYISDCETKIRRARENEHRILKSIYIDAAEEFRMVRDFSAALFDRRVTDKDFLDIRLGYGSIRSRQPVTCKVHEVYETNDPLFSLPGELQKKYEFLADAPACIHGARAGAAGVLGDLPQLCHFLCTTVLDLAVRQYSDDVRIHFLLSERFSDELHALRFLPHARNPETGRRNIAYHDESRTALLEQLFKAVSERASNPKQAQTAPWLVIYVDAGEAYTMGHPLMRYIHRAAELHLLFIFLAAQREQIPQGCTSLVRMMSNVPMGLITSLEATQPDQLYTYAALTNEQMNEAAIKLAPVHTGEMRLSSRLKGNESLFDMLGVKAAAEIDVAGTWRQADSARQLAAPLGIRDDGSLQLLDLHERAHGPHGLVAGMTGSGKSQVLISYLLALASRYSPEDVTFAVIDFKGGDIVKQLPELPHIVGSITNLEKDEIERSFRSIRAEVNKRMLLFDQDHANVSNISEYTKAYKAGKTSIPLPHLIIIVDEFAELKSQYPDFMQNLISIARIGRSLGVHLILCTQKPAGIVDGQIWSNSNFHLCLKVQNAADSNEVLASPLAAEIREPGRGYLQVEQMVFELFQSGYSGHPEVAAGQGEKPFAIHALDLSGKPETLYAHTPACSTGSRTQREAVLAQIISAFRASGMALPQPLCLPPLPAALPYQTTESLCDYQLPIGLYDDPDGQMIHPLTLDVTDDNVLILGTAQMGKTNLLLTLIRRLHEHMNAGDVAVYALDFNAKAIKSLESLRLIGGVVTEDEEEKLKSLMKLLRQEIMQRKEKFAQHKVTTFRAYRDMQHDLPAILVMIDNYAVFHDLYEEKYGDELLFLLREGPAYGITFIVTAAQVSTLGYKKPAYFKQRFALAMNEKSDYMTVFEGCRLSLPDLPGRVLFMQNRQFYTGQIFEAFSGSTEMRRIEARQAFLARHAGGPRARAIPSVPSVLTFKYLQANYPEAFTPGRYPVAMAYSDVSPVSVSTGRSASLTLAGGRDETRNRFLCMLLSLIIRDRSSTPATLYIFDGFYRPLKMFKGHPAVTQYSCLPEDIAPCLDELQEQLDQLGSGGFDAVANRPANIVVINSMDIIKHISADMMLMERFTTLAEAYRRLNLFFLFSDVPNKPVRFSSPDLIKYISEEKQALLFDDLGAVHLYDISLATVREHNRPILGDEAFLLDGDDVARVKLCTQ